MKFSALKRIICDHIIVILCLIWCGSMFEILSILRTAKVIKIVQIMLKTRRLASVAIVNVCKSDIFAIPKQAKSIQSIFVAVTDAIPMHKTKSFNFSDGSRALCIIA
jgi:hypothetical protein